MPDRTYRATVDVTLPDDLDGGALNALLSILLTALNDAEVQVTHANGEELRRYAGVHRVEDSALWTCAERGHMPLLNGGCQVCGVRSETVACEWCGRAIHYVGRQWLAIKADERGYAPHHCEANHDDGRHEPPEGQS